MQVAILYPVVKEKSEKIAQNRDFLNRYVKLFESDFLLCFVFILWVLKAAENETQRGTNMFWSRVTTLFVPTLSSFFAPSRLGIHLILCDL